MKQKLSEFDDGEEVLIELEYMCDDIKSVEYEIVDGGYGYVFIK